MSDYPEHEKLQEVKDESQAIGLFLDHGLSEQRLTIYERITEDCDCPACAHRRGREEGMHTKAERTLAFENNGKVPLTRYRPTQRTIQSILATYFRIDEKKLAQEKDAIYQRMLDAAGAR